MYSCFINTGLQCLLSIHEFVEYFEKTSYNQIKYETHSARQRFCQETTKLVRTMSNSQPTIVKNTTFRELIEKKF